MKSGKLNSMSAPDKDSSVQPSGTVRAVERAARIVAALAEHPHPMGVLELAGHVKLSPASAHRMLATLMSVGWVEQNARTAKYRLGTQLMGVGSTGLITSPIIQHGREFLMELAETTGYHTALSTLVGLRVIHLARVPGKEGGTPDFEPGVSQPAHAMADGKVLLAYLSEAERSYLYDVDELTAYTDRTFVTPHELEKELALIQSRGYATDNYERFEHVRGIAVPVLDLEGKPLLAMLAIGDIAKGQQYEGQLVSYMKAIAAEMSSCFAVTGEMPKPSTRFARYNLE